MQKLIQGIHQFEQRDFRPMKGLFEQLAHGQNPETLFITCSDSRIDPNLLTRSKPGDLFILRNAGNIIPPYGAANSSEGATSWRRARSLLSSRNRSSSCLSPSRLPLPSRPPRAWQQHIPSS